MYLCDSHTHSLFSHDTDADLDEMCAAAISAGMDELCVTDHFDANLITDDDPIYEPDKAEPAIRTIAEKYAGRLTVTYGLELGEPHELPEYTEALLSSGHRFDYIIGSLHNLKGAPDFYCVDFRSMSDDEIDKTYDSYIEQTLEMIEYGGFMSLGHFGYPLRIIYGKGRTIDLSRHEPGTEKVLSEIISRDIALEINTCTLRMELGSVTPVPSVIEKYFSMGGRRITIGSDAHDPDRIGYAVADTQKALYDMGFREITVYHGGRPEQRKISFD